MTQLWTFDLGEASGIAYGWYGPNQPYELRRTWQIEGGTEGLIDWFATPCDVSPAFNATAVCERFILNPHNEFQAEIEGVRGEGALMAVWPGNWPIVWQPRSKKFMGYGATDTTRADEILKETGLWQEPPPNHEDSRDVNDALIHALVYLRDQKHIPTMKRYLSGT